MLDDETAMARVTEVLTNGEDARPGRHTIGWVPMVKFGGVDYLRQWNVAGQDHRDITAEALGPELYRVAFRGDGYAGPYYSSEDGDATHLNPGTPVYAVKGYSPEFQLGTLEDSRPTLYEADTKPFAKTGEDLLDIRGKVTAIDFLNDDEAMTILGTMDDEGTIERFVSLVLEAPVNQNSRDREGPRYFLGIRLADGTSVVRAFWLETGELSRGIMTDPVVTLSVWRKMPIEHLPVGTDPGPRISERLASRLSLAYLSFNWPALDATGKPHSPTTRLVRASEFNAMQGGRQGRWPRIHCSGWLKLGVHGARAALHPRKPVRTVRWVRLRWTPTRGQCMELSTGTNRCLNAAAPRDLLRLGNRHSNAAEARGDMGFAAGTHSTLTLNGLRFRAG